MGKELLSFSICSSLALLLLVGCLSKQESDPQTKMVKEYLKTKYEVEPGETIDRIYIINDMGCGNCVLSLSEFVKQRVNDEHAWIIVNSRGMNVDLNVFETKKQTNPHILINHQPVGDTDDPFYHSGVVYLKAGKVDTLINLSGDDPAGTLQTIFEREKQRSPGSSGK